MAYCQNLTALHNHTDLRPEPKICKHSSLLDISDLQLNHFAHGQTQITDTDESILIEDQLFEISTHEELKLMFELGNHKFWLQSQIPILYHALWVIVKSNFRPCIIGYSTEFFDCFPVFLFGRTKIQWRYEPHHKKQQQKYKIIND